MATARYGPEEPAQAALVVRAEHGSKSAQLRVPIEILAELAGQERASGIPEPVAVEARGERWRSRFRDGRWEFNSAHKDYEEVAGVATKRLKYLVHLFLETVLPICRSGDLELLGAVEVLTHQPDSPPRRMRRTA
jgi:hypothetical protein